MASHQANSGQPLRSTHGRTINAAPQVHQWISTLDQTSRQLEHRRDVPARARTAVRHGLNKMSAGLKRALENPSSRRTPRNLVFSVESNGSFTDIASTLVVYDEKTKQLGSPVDAGAGPNTAVLIETTEELVQGYKDCLPSLGIDSDIEEELKTESEEASRRLVSAKADSDQSGRFVNNNSGSGPLSLNQGSGPQNVNNGDGQFFTGTFSAPFHFGAKHK